MGSRKRDILTVGKAAHNTWRRDRCAVGCPIALTTINPMPPRSTSPENRRKAAEKRLPEGGSVEPAAGQHLARAALIDRSVGGEWARRRRVGALLVIGNRARIVRHAAPCPHAP